MIFCSCVIVVSVTPEGGPRSQHSVRTAPRPPALPRKTNYDCQVKSELTHEHVKNVPGRKTDVNDATWLADLMAHGLIRGSFVPDAQTQELRALLRTRKQFVRERSSHIQRLQKTLEEANIKLDSVISDILGLSGRAMIEALIAGESDP